MRLLRSASDHYPKLRRLLPHATSAVKSNFIVDRIDESSDAKALIDICKIRQYDQLFFKIDKDNIDNEIDKLNENDDDDDDDDSDDDNDDACSYLRDLMLNCM